MSTAVRFDDAHRARWATSPRVDGVVPGRPCSGRERWRWGSRPGSRSRRSSSGGSGPGPGAGLGGDRGTGADVSGSGVGGERRWRGKFMHLCDRPLHAVQRASDHERFSETRDHLQRGRARWFKHDTRKVGVVRETGEAARPPRHAAKPGWVGQNRERRQNARARETQVLSQGEACFKYRDPRRRRPS